MSALGREERRAFLIHLPGFEATLHLVDPSTKRLAGADMLAVLQRVFNKATDRLDVAAISECAIWGNMQVVIGRH